MVITQRFLTEIKYKAKCPLSTSIPLEHSTVTPC